MKLKIAVGAALIIYASVVGGILIANFATKDNKQPSAQSGNNQATVLTVEEVSRHSTANDCWLIISNDVYNVTSFISSHPGGASMIVPNCGKDATTAFQTQGGRGSHSAAARSQLASLKIGAIGSAQNSTTSNSAQSATNPTQTPLPAVIITRYPNATLLESELAGDDQQYRISVQGQCREIRLKNGAIERDREC